MAPPPSIVPRTIPHLLTVLLTAFTTTPTTAATIPPHPACPNLLLNPSFEAGLLPWLPITTSPFPDRGVTTDSALAHTGSHVYRAVSSSIGAASLALSQSGVNVSAGREVDCFAWVRGKGGVDVRVEVLLDGISCGVGEVGGGDEGWVRVGGGMTVGSGRETGSTVVVVASGEGEWEVWVDDVGVVGC